MKKNYFIQVFILAILFSYVFSSSILFHSNLCNKDTCRLGECEQFKDNFKCHCAEGKKGKNCEFLMDENDDPCSSNPCWNNGKCIKLDMNDYRCECLSDYGGKNCKEIRNFTCVTKNNLCKNNGICLVSSGKNITCQCVNDWTGQYCETKLPICSNEFDLPCYNKGICLNNICICPENFFGKRCETFDLKKYELIVKNRVRTVNYLSSNTKYKCRV